MMAAGSMETQTPGISREIAPESDSPRKHEPTVWIIILTWNGLADTMACLESLRELKYSNHRIVVVDNGSSDGAPARIRESFPEVVVIENGANLGYAEGNNVGIRYAMEHQADYVVLLNNDTKADPRFVSCFLDAAAADPEAGVFAAKIYYYARPRTIWYAGGRWNGKRGRYMHDGSNQDDDGHTWETIREVDSACGCAMMVRREVIEKVGMLDPDYFIYWEEVDWCFRARRGGYKCIFVPSALVWHKVGASFDAENNSKPWQYYLIRNQLLWMERHLGKWSMWKWILRIFFLRRLFRYLWKAAVPFGNPAKRGASRAALTGFVHYFRRRFGRGPDWLLLKDVRDTKRK